MTQIKPARWLQEVLADARLSDVDRLVARALAAHMDEHGRVQATDDDILLWVAELQGAVQ